MEQPIKQLTHLKINWFKNASETGGAQNKAIAEMTEGNILLNCVSKKFGRMWGSINPSQMVHITSKDNGMYEVMSHFPHKVYFDVDKRNNTNPNYLDFIKSKIEGIFPNADMAVSGSVTDVKTSYHIVLNNYHISNKEDRETMKAITKYLVDKVDDGFDWKVYTKNRNMKAINQSKGDGRIQSVISPEDPTKHFITCHFNADILPFPTFETDSPIATSVQVAKSKKTFDLSTLPKMSLPLADDKDVNNMKADDLLSLVPLNAIEYDHTYTHMICRFCYYNKLSIGHFLAWYNKKSTKQTDHIKWMTHWQKMDQFPPVTIDRIKTLLSVFYPTIRKTLKENKFNNLFDLKNEVIVESLDQSVFNNDSKFTILNTGMGSGKTFQTIKYLKEQSSFIWMTPIIALAQNTSYRLTEDGIEHKYYKDVTSKAERNRLNEEDKLIVCINSLLYTDTKTYKVVVIDEIETLLHKWFNNTTLKANKTELWNRFVSIIENAEKVILLDAFTSNITLNFVKSFTNNSNTVYKLTSNPNSRTVNVISDKKHWLYNIIQTLKDNKKVFIFYPFKNGNKLNESIESVKLMIEKATNKVGVSYYADADDSVLKGLKNVNESWQAVDFVITNSKITVGINYEVNDYDSVFIAISGFTSPRDAIQVSYRCRNIASSNINVVFIDKFNSQNSFLKDDQEVKDDEKYASLVKDILIEKYAPLQQSFFKFCKMANYKMSASKNAIIKNVDKILEDFVEQDFGYQFEDIPLIKYTELEELKSKMILQNATVIDKLAIKKYYYVHSFVNGTDINSIGESWNNKYFFFFDQLKDVIKNPEHILNKIKASQNWTTIFPEDSQIKKTKFDEETFKLIFDAVFFKDLNEKSKHMIVFKNTINTYFNQKIIDQRKDEFKHCFYFISELNREMLSFGCQYLKSEDNDNFDSSFLDENTDDQQEEELINVITIPEPIIEVPKIKMSKRTINWATGDSY